MICLLACHPSANLISAWQKRIFIPTLERLPIPDLSTDRQRALYAGAPQERQPIPDDRAPVNDGLPHHEFVPSEFAPDSGRCDKCGGGPLAPIHLKPVDQMARIADALEGILEILTQRNDWEAQDRIYTQNVTVQYQCRNCHRTFTRVSLATEAINQVKCEFCGLLDASPERVV